MRLSTFLREIGRPIAYYPRLAKVLGGVKAAVLLCQLCYWSDKTTDPLGVYKTSEEIESETGLSYKEQVAARLMLRQKKILHENYDRLNHRMFFLVEFEALDTTWDNYLINNELTKSTFGNVQNSSSGTTEWVIPEHTKAAVDITETTAKITAENTTTTDVVVSDKEKKFDSIQTELARQELIVTDKALKKMVSDFSFDGVLHCAEVMVYQIAKGITPKDRTIPSKLLRYFCVQNREGTLARPAGFISSKERCEQERRQAAEKAAKAEQMRTMEHVPAEEREKLKQRYYPALGGK